jgi:uncharacterized membrane protein YbhN (UPF0104 family)
MALLKRIVPLFGPLLMAYIFLRYVRLGDVIAVFGRASLLFLAASLGWNLLLMFGKIHRLHTLLHREGAGLGFFALARSYSVANLLGQVSNLLVSDLVNAAALMAGSDRKGRIAAVFVFNRVCDLASVVLLMLLFFFMEGERLRGFLGLQQGNPVFLLVMLLVLGAVCLLFRERLRQVAEDFLELALRNWVPALCYALFIYLCYSLGALSEAKALRLELPGGFLLLSYFLGSLISILPISVAGIGTRELVFVFLLKLVGIAPEGAVALSTLGFLLVPSLSLCLVYLVSLWGERHEASLHG